MKMEEPGFWDKSEESQNVMKEVKGTERRRGRSIVS